MLHHRRLARHFGNNIWLARNEIIECLDDVDAGKFCPRGIAAPGPGERADDPHTALRSGRAQRRHHILRHAAAADEADCGHRGFSTIEESCPGLTRASIFLRKMMDCRVISAFTRVFRRAVPGNDEFGISPASRSTFIVDSAACP